MPNSAYTTLVGSFAFCPTAVIAAAVPLQITSTSVVISGLSSSIANPIVAGMGAMINDEIVIVQSFSGNNLSLLRGCADTIPQAHAAGSRIWFFESSIGRVPTEYAAVGNVSVKPLPRTSTGVVPIESSPPLGVTLNSRFARPYAPGNVQVNGQRWDASGILVNAANPLVLSWAHRNRVVQADLLVPHTEASITPELGQVCRVRMYRASDNSLRGTYTTADTSLTYTVGQANLDLGSISSNTAMYAIITALRDGLDSRAQYRVDFTASPSVAATQSFSVAYNFDPPPTQSFSISYNID